MICKFISYLSILNINGTKDRCGERYRAEDKMLLLEAQRQKA